MAPRSTIQLKPHTPTLQDIDDDSNCSSETEDESPQALETTTDIPQRRMSPQFARQKAADLSYEIGALVKIKERLERERERLISMYYTDWSESDAQVISGSSLFDNFLMLTVSYLSEKGAI